MLQNAGGQIQESHREKEQVNCSLLLIEEEQEEEDPVENPRSNQDRMHQA